MKRFSSIRKDKRASTDMAAPQTTAAAAPIRQETISSIASDEAVPASDPNTVCDRCDPIHVGGGGRGEYGVHLTDRT